MTARVRILLAVSYIGYFLLYIAYKPEPQEVFFEHRNAHSPETKA